MIDWLKRRHESHTIATQRFRILALSIYMDDRLLLERMRRRYDWELRFTYSPEVGLCLASQAHHDLILCARNQPGHPWRVVMESLSACSSRSRILLVSHVSSDALWRDVLQQGGYDILARPLREAEVLQAVQSVSRFVSAENRLGDEALPHRV